MDMFGKTRINKKKIINIKATFPYLGPLTFATRGPLLHPPPQNPLSHESDINQPKNRPFEDLKFHGRDYKQNSIDVNQSDHGTSSMTNHMF